MHDPLPRRVVYSQVLLERIKELSALADQQGRLASFSAALTTIHEDLQHRPLSPFDDNDALGEPCYTLKHMGLQVCVAALAPVVVHFGVSLAPQQVGADTFVGVYVMSLHLMG